VIPAQGFAGQGDLVVAQGGAVALFLALLVRRAESDDGFLAPRILGQALKVETRNSLYSAIGGDLVL
jgi:hypothetical protein